MDIIVEQNIEPYIGDIKLLIKEYLDWWMEEAKQKWGYDHLQKFANKEAVYDDFINRYLDPDDFRSANGLLYLAQENEKIIGMVALMETSSDVVELKRNYVATDFRGRGYARQLVNKLIGDAKNRGYSKIVLDSSIFMRAAHSLYRSVGFEKAKPFEGAEFGKDNLQKFMVFMELRL